MNRREPCRACGSVPLAVSLFVVLGAALLPAWPAAEAPIHNRLRAAVELPSADLQISFGFTGAQDWLSEPPVADPTAELARLRARLKGEPSDAPLLSEIARILARFGDPQAATTAQQEALASWRRRADATPGNRTVQLGLAQALRAGHQAPEAERLLRQLVAEPDAPWEARYELATTLGESVFTLMLLTPDGTPGLLASQEPPDAARLEEAEQRVREALTLADELVAAAPDDPRGWARRARLRTDQALLALAQGPRAEGLGGGQQLTRAFWPATALPDLEAALKLRPDDPRLVFGCFVHRVADKLPELMATAVESGGASGNPDLTPDEARAVTETLSRLDRLAESPDRGRAAAALGHAAIVRLLFRGGLVGAGELAQRAFDLDPWDAEAFQLALMSVVGRERPDWQRAEALVRARLKARSDAATHYLLVRALFRADRISDALAEVHHANKAWPRDARLHVAHVALHVRAGDWPSADHQEAAHLTTTGDQVQALPEGPEKHRLSAHFMTTVAVLMALDGEVALAAEQVERVLQRFPENAYAREIRPLLAQLLAR